VDKDCVKGRLGRAWPVVLIVVLAAGGILAVKSSRATSQSQTRTITAGQEPMRLSAVLEVPQAQSTETAEPPSPATLSAAVQTTPGVRVEIIHFHGTHQCNSCKMVGALAEKTAQTHFRDELRAGQITFAHVNGQLAENREMVLKYGATSSSLWIGTIIDGALHKEQNFEVWRKIQNEGEYMEYLKGLLEKRLNGDLE
jgi:hypothetical protein